MWGALDREYVGRGVTEEGELGKKHLLNQNQR